MSSPHKVTRPQTILKFFWPGSETSTTDQTSTPAALKVEALKGENIFLCKNIFVAIVKKKFMLKIFN
jgi:hypothetical protein